jgi:nitrilase
MWLVAGTIPIATAEPAKVAAACLVLDPDGRTVARYDKIHLFDVNIPGRDERYMESGTVLHGGEPVCVDTPAGRLGLAVCYDVRFPELFRELGRAGADWFCLPSAFTAPTGRAHWEVLLRARAIENLASMVAPAQSGFHDNGRETYGDTMIVDCWGRVQSRLPRGTGVVIGRIDLVRQREVRQNFPVLTHRRPS